MKQTLDVDGARTMQGGKISAGGILRDQNGSWIMGFAATMGAGKVIEAEAWGLLIGLQMTASVSNTNLMVDCDSETLVHMVQHGVDEVHPLKSILDCCKFYQAKFSDLKISHVYRELNAVADALSKSSNDFDFGINFMEQPPPQIIHLLLDDICEVTRMRTCNHSIF